MDVIDSIVAQPKRSDLQQDYVQITETLLQKIKFLAEWVSRFYCPIVDCSLHNHNINASNVNNGNNSKVNVNVKNKSNDASNNGAKDSGEFKTPNKKLIAKANFTYSKDKTSDVIVTNNQFNALSTDAAVEEESVTIVGKMPPIIVKPKVNL
ncbi:hypothetical protein CEXT_163221 [Caerostris extrusa]|uniref:Uncharacterized protein n=1 Tax=Caerostris extrusa TaxID=172846 RepID=A0AAV4PX19_CAEEX|nr:hypothetical protein CEXT_163221 [Caerostris extrusa]